MAGSRLHHGYFYENDELLTERLVKIVRESLAEDRMVMLFITRAHMEQLDAALAQDAPSVRAAMNTREFRIFDADMLRDRLIENGNVNLERFNATFAALLREADETGKEVTVCGEIVNILWNEGNADAALQLEKLWDDVLDRRAFHIHCLYNAPVSEKERSAFKSVEVLHSRQPA